METFSIYHDLLIKSKTNLVWEAITAPDKLINWWPRKCTGKPELNAEYNFVFTPEYNWYGKVVVCQPNQSFHIKMTKADPDWNPTSFGFDLSIVDSGTHVKFKHIDWPACNDHFRRSSYCWAILLKGLKDYVEQGIIVPFEQRE